MALTATPYGFRPVNGHGLSGEGSGATMEYLIEPGYATDMFYGMPVTVDGGYVIAQAATPVGTVNPVFGVAVGFRYLDPLGNWVINNWYNGDAGNLECYASVITDPNQVFAVQANDQTMVITDVGLNAAIVPGTGSTTTGNSNGSVDGDTAAVTATLAVEIIGLNPAITSNNAWGTDYVDLLVKFAVGAHKQSATAVGLAT